MRGILMKLKEWMPEFITAIDRVTTDCNTHSSNIRLFEDYADRFLHQLFLTNGKQLASLLHHMIM